MENPPQFDLNESIQRWRANLEASSAFHATDLNELEGHLRDSINVLEAKGLSLQEAFLIAARRLGSPETLSTEFGKVNRKRERLISILLVITSIVALRLLLPFIPVPGLDGPRLGTNLSEHVGHQSFLYDYMRFLISETGALIGFFTLTMTALLAAANLRLSKKFLTMPRLLTIAALLLFFTTSCNRTTYESIHIAQVRHMPSFSARVDNVILTDMNTYNPGEGMFASLWFIKDDGKRVAIGGSKATPAMVAFAQSLKVNQTYAFPQALLDFEKRTGHKLQ